jgi:hypothetical protein
MAHLVSGQCLLYKGQSSCMCMQQPDAGIVMMLVDRFAAGVCHEQPLKKDMLKPAS